MAAVPVNPWATPEGERARIAQLRLLAQGDGEMAEYAREVLDGRVPARTLLYASVLPGPAIDSLYETVDRWRELPDAQREELVGGAAAETNRLIRELAALAEPSPDEDPDTEPDEDEGYGPITYDAW